MYKKSAFSEATGWFLGLLIVFIVLAILVFGPKNLYAGAKDAVFNFGSNLLPKEKPPQFAAEQRVPPEVEQYFNNLVSKIRDSGVGEVCWIDNKIPKMNAFSINLYNDKIELQKVSSRGSTPPEKSESVEGFKPCSVRGIKAKAFYYCMRDGNKCNDVYQEDNSIIINDDTNIAPFLFKFDNSHICVIYLDGTDSTYGCNEVKDLIDDACVEQIQRTYSDCSIAAPPKPQFEKECDAINYCYSKAQVINANPKLPCEIAPSTPKAYFQTYADCVKGSLCILQHTSKFGKLGETKICDDSNKEKDILTGIDIWAWPKYIKR